MSNQLVIPFKRATDPPIGEAVREYLAKYHPEVLPDDFLWDIAHWESLRTQISSDTVHATIVDTTLKYHAQLVLMLTKLPVDIDLPITYYHAFHPSQPPLTLSNLAYERVCVLFNLAALFSQLAEAQDRSTSDGIRRASGYYQNAAGTYTYLLESGIPPFVASLTHPLSSSDLSKPVVKTLELLMLAQAAECYWQKAVADNLRNGTISRLSMQVATFYGMAYNALQSTPNLAGSALPTSWLAHMQTKKHHFEAAAQVRKAMDDSENNRYGCEVARLASARVYAKQGQDSAKRGVSSAVIEDINALCLWIENRAVEAQRDNDLIYHEEVPSVSNLEIIEPANLVNSAILGGLRDPQTSLSGEEALFGKLISWGARTAINVYNERKHNMVASIRQIQQDLDRAATSKLQELNLPNALELLDRPMTLPSSLLAKASEVRADNGPMRIRQLLEDVERLSTQDRNLLNEAYDILDSEVEEDESYHKRFGSRWPRASSQVANEELLGKVQHFNTVFEQALDSDRKVKAMWKEWTSAIEALASNEDILAMLPASSPTPRGKMSPLTTQTKSHVRILRGHLESLEELRRNRQHALLRAQSLAAGDDISDRIKLVALGLERWTQVKAEMFEDVMAEELGKYDKYQSEITATKEEQDSLLKKIEERNALLLQSRKDDPINKNADAIAKNLNVAYTKYNEIVKNCSDGLTFYGDFAGHLSSLRDSCRQWTYTRRKDANSLVEHLELLSLSEPQTQSPITPADEIPPPPTLSPPGSSPETATSSPPPSPSTSRSSNRQNLTPRSTQPAIIADIPHPNSSQWEPLVPIPTTSSPVVSSGPSASKSKRQSRDGASPSVTPIAQGPSTSNGSRGSKPKRQIY